jgi:hypothetical protein
MRRTVKLKFFVVCILVIPFVLTIFSTSSARNAFPDVPTGVPYAQAVNELAEMGVFQGDPMGNFNPERTMTRAEAAALLVRLFVADDTVASGSGSFNDVPTSHWAYAYIETAVANGMISGYGDGRYGPGDALTFNQAVTLILRALGFEDMAQRRGGWPGGYISVGNEIGITQNTVNIGNIPVRRSTVAVLIHNALPINPPVESGGIEGIWILERMEISGIAISDDEIGGLFPVGMPSLRLSDDGTVDMFNISIAYDVVTDTFIGIVEFGTYKIDDNSISISVREGHEVNLLRAGTTLLWQTDGITMQFRYQEA